LNRVQREARRWLAQLQKAVLGFRLGQRWVDQGGIATRAYDNYHDYLEHQRLKFDAMRTRSLESHDRRFYTALRERLAALPFPLVRRSVLCLAARQGTEVRAFIDQGAFAIGIDLNPGKNNPYVLPGDFHNLQFAAGSVDLVYTNSLDHAFDLKRLLAEVKRVLATDGLFLIEAGAGAETHSGRGFYESLAWESTDQLLGQVTKHGFLLEKRSRFLQPWAGEQFLLRSQ
jgi:SAM-dependent methyltransferase